MHSLAVLVWLALCAGQDARERQISNVLTLGAAACALVWLLTTGHSWLGAQGSEAALGFVIVLLLTLPGYMLGQFGAGDVKLLGALALASSLDHVLGTFIGAGVVLVLWLLVRRKTRQPGEKRPFAPFLLAGFALSLAWGWLSPQAA
ncbi:prepilin peptidase [Pseudomonas sp. PSKL.D1]|uniref:prepilin peptidase n=1 Tax=Pseudomonas sp. PSKL.D1 TaxID=3029060 RepID=UPI002380FD22|nr:A24 family peptidase [Pseudomonas sp. PSKL.D1]WDY58804.1 A24 family peptidase [Pseudomonas sp. PSKL.D1]